METGREDVALVLNSCIWDAGSQQASDEQHAQAGDSVRPRAAQNVRFEELYEHYFEFVWRSLRMLGVPEPSLDDAAQDVFGTVARQLPYFEGRSSLRTWVFGIAQFTASNHRRGQRRKAAPLEPLPEGLESQVPGPECEAQAGELREVILNFCAALDESRRAVFVLGLLEEVPPLEIAQLLEIPLNTVYSRLRALRQALRLRLERWEESR